jgi:hypothetical protein
MLYRPTLHFKTRAAVAEVFAALSPHRSQLFVLAAPITRHISQRCHLSTVLLYASIAPLLKHHSSCIKKENIKINAISMRQLSLIKTILAATLRFVPMKIYSNENLFKTKFHNNAE